MHINCRNASAFRQFYSVCVDTVTVSAEKKGDAPQTCDAHQGVNDAANGAHLTTEEEGHAVEAEQTYAAPVQCANNNKH